jgi:hypothetical protein
LLFCHTLKGFKALNVRPYQEENAIKIVAFTLELTRELSVSEIESFDAAFDLESSSLRHKELIKSYSVKIEQGQPTQQQAEGLAGYKYSSDEGHEPEWLLSVRDNQIAVICRKYTSWTLIVAKAKSLLKSSMEVLGGLENISVSASGLQYLDQFIIVDSSSEWKQDLFRRNSKYLPAYVYELADYWHTHNGYLGQNKDIKVLNNFNLNHRKEEGGDSDEVALVTQHRCLNGQITLKDAISRFSDHLEYMHEENKSIVGELFSDAALGSIKFGGK